MKVDINKKQILVSGARNKALIEINRSRREVKILEGQSFAKIGFGDFKGILIRRIARMSNNRPDGSQRRYVVEIAVLHCWLIRESV